MDSRSPLFNFKSLENEQITVRIREKVSYSWHQCVGGPKGSKT
jgi:hypothetical protein